jgi:hypothetical protein
MKKVLAIARLDFQRLGFGLLAAGLIAGLLPPFASGLGLDMEQDRVLAGLFALAGLVCGVRFGIDFLEGRGSFFFARPLPSWVLFISRFMTMLGLAVMTYVALMASNWLATSERAAWRVWPVARLHLEVLISCWALSFFFGVAASAHSHSRPGQNRVPAWILIPLRLVLGLGLAITIFGFFADLAMRAYKSQLPARLFIGSWIAAAFAAGCAAVVQGRTERLRMARFISGVLFAHLALSSLVLASMWSYVLRPGPEAIKGVQRAEVSPDGRTALLFARVDRGDPDKSFPTFLLDLGAEKATGLPSEPGQGPWWSSDGRVMVWNQASVIFVSQLFNLMRGSTPFRFRIGDGPAEDVPMPSATTSRVASRADIFRGWVLGVFPSSDGDLFLIHSMRGVSFVSRSRGPLSEFVPDRGPMMPVAMTLMGTNQLRIATLRREGTMRMLDFADIDSTTAKRTILRTLTLPPPPELPNGPALPGAPHVHVFFDREGQRCLVSLGPGLRRDQILLVNLEGAAVAKPPVALLSGVVVPDLMFLSDGRVAATQQSKEGMSLRTFSTEGAPLLNVRVPGLSRLALEMFPGLIAGAAASSGSWDLLLLDAATGEPARRIEWFSSAMDLRWARRPPTPGTPGARLLRSKEEALYDLATPAAEPRLILPRS